jgi:hypothetical protein
MRAAKPSTKPVFMFQDPLKPVKIRIAEAAHMAFRWYGMPVWPRLLADLAHTNVEVVNKLFRPGQLQFDFLKSLYEELNSEWEAAKRYDPDDPEAQLRIWLLYVSRASSDWGFAHWQLGRVGAQNAYPRENAFSRHINGFRQVERRRIQEKCAEAKFRAPNELADKLLLLIEGARNERSSYGYEELARVLCLAADDLMVAHGAVRKPPISDID